MSAEVKDFEASCQTRHQSVCGSRQDGIGWMAVLFALAGLCLALAGAQGWGEVPNHRPSQEPLAPQSEVHNSNAVGNQDAGQPDAVLQKDSQLVGMLPLV